jgi:hypothetical protein
MKGTQVYDALLQGARLFFAGMNTTIGVIGYQRGSDKRAGLQTRRRRPGRDSDVRAPGAYHV